VLETCATCDGNLKRIVEGRSSFDFCHSQSQGFDLLQFPLFDSSEFSLWRGELQSDPGKEREDLEELLSKFSAGMHLTRPEIKPNCVWIDWNYIGVMGSGYRGRVKFIDMW